MLMPSAKKTVATMMRKLSRKLRQLMSLRRRRALERAAAASSVRPYQGHRCGSMHRPGSSHNGRGEKIDAIQAGGVIDALALDEEDRKREHQDVVHRPFAQPFERVQTAGMAGDFGGGSVETSSR